MLKKIIKKIIKIVLTTILTISILVAGINVFIIYITKPKILTTQQLTEYDFDYILVLGAAVWGERPSHLLEDRLIKGIELYQQNVASTMLMSGDHGQANYDEVSVMRNYAIESGVNPDDIVMDHAGFSTYDSLYRAKNTFKAKRIVIVTQDYHLYRALYIGEKLGLEVYGYSANIREFNDQIKWDIREVLARTKDFFKVIVKPQAIHLQKSLPFK